jgi:hypothetical protein
LSRNDAPEGERRRNLNQPVDKLIHGCFAEMMHQREKDEEIKTNLLIRLTHRCCGGIVNQSEYEEKLVQLNDWLLVLYWLVCRHDGPE